MTHTMLTLTNDVTGETRKIRIYPTIAGFGATTNVEMSQEDTHETRAQALSDLANELGDFLGDGETPEKVMYIMTVECTERPSGVLLSREHIAYDGHPSMTESQKRLFKTESVVDMLEQIYGPLVYSRFNASAYGFGTFRGSEYNWTIYNKTPDDFRETFGDDAVYIDQTS
jgi:hypothetical protein